MLDDAEARRRGRLFRIRLRRNSLARAAALASVVQVGSRWVARVGGRIRWRAIDAGTREEAERQVMDHYNDQMMTFIKVLNRARH